MTIFSHREFAEDLAAGLEAGRGVFHSWLLYQGTPAIVCSSFLLPQGQLAPVDGWEIILGEDMGMFGWEDEIWGHSCCLHPSKGALWVEEKEGLVHWALKGVIRICGGSDREAEGPDRFEIKFQIKHFLGISIGKLEENPITLLFSNCCQEQQRAMLGSGDQWSLCRKGETQIGKLHQLGKLDSGL